ncbi:MAG: hypothetical protein M4579_003186 [Chaenotheca gracillima]|nr:MAG: hypothetical protein M4579_003186 [Chaenotheca gracillima]
MSRRVSASRGSSSQALKPPPFSPLSHNGEASGNDGSSSGSPAAGPGDRLSGHSHPQSDLPPTASAPSLLTGKPSIRSVHHRSYYASSPTPRDVPQYSSQRVREQTAELASYALSDASSYYGSPPLRRYSSSQAEFPLWSDEQDEGRSIDGSNHHSDSHPEVITEVSEPPSPDWSQPAQPSPGTSVLTQLLRSSPPDDEDQQEEGRSLSRSKSRSHDHARDRPRRSMDEDSHLLSHDFLKRSYDPSGPGDNDLEGQDEGRRGRWAAVSSSVSRRKEKGVALARTVLSPKSWDRRVIWKQGLVRPLGYLPAVVLGLLLNILDALSYGMILFPLGTPIFADLGPDGISMFYVSCIISQLVYSCGGSIFKGGIGSEMIEVVPFFHKMAFTILADIGEDNPKAVLATTILAYAISSVLTGLVFFLMGACRLGALIGFFPRHILIGCIGGVGWFLVVTGLEVSGRLGHVEYDLETLQKLFEPKTIPLWMIPLALAIFQIISRRWIKHQLFFTGYFLAIPAVFYFFVAAIPDLKLEDLRALGWVFEAPEAGAPFYHFYTLYDFGAVHWGVLAKTIPAMFALTFFGILHVPINVPALGVSTGEDNVNVDRELIAHGVSNALSGFAGSIQNYLVYSNSVLFIRNGGESRVAGVLLAVGTFGIMVSGPTIIGYIPIMVVGALIFLLGIELLGEALHNTWGKLNKLEYLTVVAIVVIMGVWDFVLGILAGIALACLQFVVQTSRKSAIRAAYDGTIASSTVRRHPVQYRYLREVGRQTHVAKLMGYLFFGTIVNVEKSVRALLEEEQFSKQPIRFLIVDLAHVTGLDFSAAEAFTRINRILTAKGVHLILSGASREGEIGKNLQENGLWDEGNEVMIFEDLNSALEYCENELLKAFYSRRDTLANRNTQSKVLDVPARSNSNAGSLAIPFSQETFFSSPRRSHLHQAATQTLPDQSAITLPPSILSSFKQPLPLMLQTFQDLTLYTEDFWFRACPFFSRFEYPAGTVLYHAGDAPNGFYLLEQGILRAEYALPQGKYFESIVAGTTCGELPFFSSTERTATVSAERDCIAWLLDEENWVELQRKCPDVASELLRVSLKLTSERMSAITSYVLTTAG